MLNHKIRKLPCRKKQKKIIVSGASGFIGSHLIPKLIKNGYEVLALARNPSRVKNLHFLKDVEICQFDLENKSLDVNFDSYYGLIHLAWCDLDDYNSLNHVEKSASNSYRLITSAVTGGIKNILVTGTCLEYGLQSGPLDVSKPAKPINSYALGKDTLRRNLENLAKTQPFKLQWGRLFYMYGEGQSENALLAQLDRAIATKKVFNMSFGDQLRDYLHVEQVAQQIYEVFTYCNEGTYNVCSGNPISVKELVERHIAERYKNRVKSGILFLPRL